MTHYSHLIGIFENGYAPPGWCELQRIDSPEEGEPLADDEEAARLFAKESQGPVLFHETGSGISFLVRPDTPPISAEEWAFRNRAALGVCGPPDRIPHWIVLVRADDADAIGLFPVDDPDAFPRHRDNWT